MFNNTSVNLELNYLFVRNYVSTVLLFTWQQRLCVASVCYYVILQSLIRKTTEGDGVINSEQEISRCTPFISNIFSLSLKETWRVVFHKENMVKDIIIEKTTSFLCILDNRLRLCNNITEKTYVILKVQTCSVLLMYSHLISSTHLVKYLFLWDFSVCYP